jgi:hypothetical protein
MVDHNAIVTRDTCFDFVPYDPIQVFFIEATLGPLASAMGKLKGNLFKDSFITVDGFHTGIGFVSNNISFSLGLEIISGDMKSALIPKMDTKTQTVSWDGSQNAIYLRSLDPNYWSESAYLCTITRDQFMALKNSIFTKGGFLELNPYYALFKVINDVTPPSPTPSLSYPRGSIMNPFLKSADCDDFAYYCINYLNHTLSVKLEFATRPHYTSAALVTQNLPVKLKNDDPKIWQFYSGFNSRLLKDLNTLVADCNNNSPVNATTIKSALENVEKVCGPPILAALEMNDPSAAYALLSKVLKDIQNDLSIVFRSYDENNKMAYYAVNLIVQQTSTAPKTKAKIPDGDAPKVTTHIRSPLSIKYFQYPLKEPYPILEAPALEKLKAVKHPDNWLPDHENFCRKRYSTYMLGTLVIVIFALLLWLAVRSCMKSTKINSPYTSYSIPPV